MTPEIPAVIPPTDPSKERSPEDYQMELKDVAEAQVAILATLNDDQERIAWNHAHNETFRKLWDTDPAFNKAARERDVPEMLRRIEEYERAARS